MDIRPPRRPMQVPPRPTDELPPVAAPAPTQAVPEAHLSPAPSPAALNEVTVPPPAPKQHKKWRWWLLGGMCGIVVLICLGSFAWYQLALRPVSGDSTRTRVTIVSGATPASIAKTLSDKHLIRSSLAFDIYTRLTKTRDRLQAGVYSLSPSQSTGMIVNHLVSGKVDQFNVTFYPGGTLTAMPGTPDAKKTDAQTMLLRAGFSQADISAALAKTYDLPLFADKPAGTSLEGYIYGDTYVIDSSTSVEQLLTTAFAEYQKVLTDNDVVAGFKAQGLTLYQGITLASIVQSEMGSHKADMPQVAQVFLKRYRDGISLGSDVTAYYGAALAGLPLAVTTDTPYNTRLHTGLPPGPISTPSLAALLAVAHPAAGDYSFFLTGDDGVTYYAHTDAEHQQNITDHCKVGCAVQ